MAVLESYSKTALVTEKSSLLFMLLDMLSQVAFVKGFKPTNIARIITFFAHMLAQNVGAEMGHDSELGPTVATCVLFDQFGHVVHFGFVKDKSIGCAGLELTFITEKHLLCLLFTTLNMVVQFGFHVSLKVAKIAGIFVFLKVNADLKNEEKIRKCSKIN